jgi:hypothetical protein
MQVNNAANSGALGVAAPQFQSLPVFRVSHGAPPPLTRPSLFSRRSSALPLVVDAIGHVIELARQVEQTAA